MDCWKVLEILGGGVQLAELYFKGHFEYAFEDYILWPTYSPLSFFPFFVPGYHEVNISALLCLLSPESQMTIDRHL